MILNIFLILLFVLCAGYYSGLETGTYCLNKSRLEYRRGQGWRSARFLHNLLRDPQGLVCTMLIGHNIFVFMATVALTGMLEAREIGAAELISTICLAPVLLVLAEMTPKNIFQQAADRLMYPLAWSIEVSRVVFWPVVVLLKGITRASYLLLPDIDSEHGPFFTPERVQHFISEGMEEGLLSRYQSTMAENIMKLGKIPLRTIMIPIDQATTVPRDISREHLRKLIATRRFSRFPVYENSPVTVVGILCILEFLWTEAPDVTCADLIRSATYLNAEMAIDDALLRLQRARQHMGIVVDDQSKAIGIITVKDVVEEIVGELEAW